MSQLNCEGLCNVKVKPMYVLSTWNLMLGWEKVRYAFCLTALSGENKVCNDFCEPGEESLPPMQI